MAATLRFPDSDNEKDFTCISGTVCLMVSDDNAIQAG
jgi:hypothetical protein